ncbi:MAG TPA: glycerol-3-phosphate dehydrogenase/oxidase [Herpetosiphonaceae bacterium]|nr:glycerol-3-phosphate dehydrogenase/oxidase [Herpetosiphonaceae bacterium]
MAQDGIAARQMLLDRIESDHAWDIVVIGGGATGLGTAVDAAARGFNTLLLEAHDFAKGTSSRSTKLVHGGVRYLKQGNISLVREGLHEHGLLHQNAPHLVYTLPFVIPAYTWWSQPFYGIGLNVYDVLAGRLGLGRTRILNRADTLRRAPTLELRGLRGGVLYYDGQFDDARLAITLLRTLLDLGGAAVNYVPVVALSKQGGRVTGVIARDAETGREYQIRARAVVNATGVYADVVRRMDDPQNKPMLAPSQGIHLVLDRRFLPGDSAIMVPSTEDGRVLFAIPWHNHVVIGTTDTPVTSMPIEPRPLPEEVTFVLRHAARYLSVDPRPEDVRSVFAGLRPLVRSGRSKATAALGRGHSLQVSPAGLITITGGKWTTYRRMGADTVNKAIAIAGLPRRRVATEALRLHGWTHDSEANGLAVYGSDAAAVQAVLDEQPGWSDLIHPRLHYRAGEAIWAARHEAARTVEDVLARRTRALQLDARASQEAAPLVARLLAAELGMDTAWQEAQVREYCELAQTYLLS